MVPVRDSNSGVLASGYLVARAPGASAAPAWLEIDLLGGFAVWVDGMRVAASAWRKLRSAWLVKLLAVVPGHALDADAAARTLWPSLDRQARLAALAHALADLEMNLGMALEAGGALELPSALCAVDSARFEATARRALDCAKPEVIRAALALYGGPLLPQDRYLEWLDEPRSRLERLHGALLKLDPHS